MATPPLTKKCHGVIMSRLSLGTRVKFEVSRFNRFLVCYFGTTGTQYHLSTSRCNFGHLPANWFYDNLKVNNSKFSLGIGFSNSLLSMIQLCKKSSFSGYLRVSCTWTTLSGCGRPLHNLFTMIFTYIQKHRFRH